MKRAWVCLVAVALGNGCDQVRKEAPHTTAPAVAQSRQVEPAPAPAPPAVAERAPAKVQAPVWIGDAYTLCRSSSIGLVGQTVQVTGDVHRFKITAVGATSVELDGDADGVWRVSCHFSRPARRGRGTESGRPRRDPARQTALAARWRAARRRSD
jgi:hypothetical protein